MSKKKRSSRRPAATDRASPAIATPSSAEAPVNASDAGHGVSVDAGSDITAPEPLPQPANDSVAPPSSAGRKRKVDSGSQLGSSQPSWMSQGSGDIRGVLIQIAGGRLLLPNATIAEVLSYAEPEPIESSADWLLGRFRWRGWQLPLVAFSQMAGIGQEKPGLGSKVIVLKALGDDARTPYFAVLTQGFPRLVTVSRAALELDTGDGALPVGIQALVRLNDEPALLPDLLQIEALLRDTRQAA